MKSLEEGFKYLIIAEVIIIVVIIVARLIFNYIENKKIKSVLEYIDKRANENSNNRTDKLKECIDIIKQANSKEV